MDIHSFAFRYACYMEFGWNVEDVGMLPEVEAGRLAVVFEETGAYQYRKNREMESSHGSAQDQPITHGGLRQGFEEDFSFGEEDDIDYWHFKDDGVEIVD